MRTNAIIESHYNTLLILKSGDESKYRKVITNYDSLLKKIQHVISIKSVFVHLDKAEEYYLKSNFEGEKKSLLMVLKEMKSKNITDRDFQAAGLKDYLSKTITSTKKIETRLNELNEMV